MAGQETHKERLGCTGWKATEGEGQAGGRAPRIQSKRSAAEHARVFARCGRLSVEAERKALPQKIRGSPLCSATVNTPPAPAPALAAAAMQPCAQPRCVHASACNAALCPTLLCACLSLQCSAVPNPAVCMPQPAMQRCAQPRCVHASACNAALCPTLLCACLSLQCADRMLVAQAAPSSIGPMHCTSANTLWGTAAQVYSAVLQRHGSAGHAHKAH